MPDEKRRGGGLPGPAWAGEYAEPQSGPFGKAKAFAAAHKRALAGAGAVLLLVIILAASLGGKGRPPEPLHVAPAPPPSPPPPPPPLPPPPPNVNCAAFNVSHTNSGKDPSHASLCSLELRAGAFYALGRSPNNCLNSRLQATTFCSARAAWWPLATHTSASCRQTGPTTACGTSPSRSRWTTTAAASLGALHARYTRVTTCTPACRSRAPPAAQLGQPNPLAGALRGRWPAPGHLHSHPGMLRQQHVRRHALHTYPTCGLHAPLARAAGGAASAAAGRLPRLPLLQRELRGPGANRLPLPAHAAGGASKLRRPGALCASDFPRLPHAVLRGTVIPSSRSAGA